VDRATTSSGSPFPRPNEQADGAFLRMTSPTGTVEDSVARAARVEQQYRVVNGLYLIGSLEPGVTVFGQQVRAHNIVWALAELERHGKCPSIKTIAIVGAGIAGLTAAAGALGLFPDARIVLLERSIDLCSIQQGCDTRWLHPRIYHWPQPESRNPSASLPLLNWREGRASDVADRILRSFARYLGYYRPKEPDREHPLVIYLGVEHLRIESNTRRIEWVGRRGIPKDAFVRTGDAEGRGEVFDCILLALGFGAEDSAEAYATPSYWRNEKLAQPRLDGGVQSYVISGYGDGALVDLCRLTIERFRQDRILEDLFGTEMKSVETRLGVVAQRARTEHIFPLLRDLEDAILQKPLEELRKRIRKDTKVFLHLAGKGQVNSAIQDVFGPSSSFTNRLLLYLLYRCGAFAPRFDNLRTITKEREIAPDRVICRYGPKTMEHILGVFIDSGVVEDRLKEIRSAHSQEPVFEWEPGAFRSLED
jgi:hypothetical protein